MAACLQLNLLEYSVGSGEHILAYGFPFQFATHYNPHEASANWSVDYFRLALDLGIWVLVLGGLLAAIRLIPMWRKH